MKLLRIPTSYHAASGDTEPALVTSKVRFSRMLKHKVRFRRGKNRSDRHYHSDDGYTSDPGQVRGEEEDETDGEPPLSAEVRRLQQVKELEKKLEKTKAQLHEEEESCHEYKNEYVQEMESTMNDKAQLKIKARFQTRQGSYREKSEKLKKKIEKLDEQLRQAKENPLDTHTWKQKGMASIREIRGKISSASNKLRRRRYKGESANPIDTVPPPDDLEDDEYLNPHDSDETAEVDAASQLTLKEEDQYPDHDLVEHDPEVDQNMTLLEAKQKAMEEQMEIQRKQLQELTERLSVLHEKFESEKDRAERLESQVNDMTELYQHEVSELQAQLNQMDNLTLTKSQDLEDAVAECRSKVDRLDVYIQRMEESGHVPSGSVLKTFLARLLTILLITLSLLLATSQSITRAIRTPVGLAITIIVLLMCLMLWNYYS